VCVQIDVGVEITVASRLNSPTQTDVTPAILLRNFVAQLYRATELQRATARVAHCNFVA